MYILHVYCIYIYIYIYITFFISLFPYRREGVSGGVGCTWWVGMWGWLCGLVLLALAQAPATQERKAPIQRLNSAQRYLKDNNLEAVCQGAHSGKKKLWQNIQVQETTVSPWISEKYLGGWSGVYNNIKQIPRTTETRHLYFACLCDGFRPQEI